LRIYIAGHRGLVGSALVQAINQDPNKSWIGASRTELDLFDRDSVFAYLISNKPDALIIAAAKVGGINSNRNSPVEFLSENLQIQSNLMDASHAAGIDRLLFLGSSCVYPKFANQPIREEELLTGALEITNESYAIAKIAGIKLVQAYRSEYSHNWISAMPCNIYGPGDNFDIGSSHVLPALIAKFHNAKIKGLESVTLWGSGTPRREFLYVDDLAQACLKLLDEYNDSIAINVGVGHDLSINELSILVKSIVGFSGEILWDQTMPDGTPRKLLNIDRISALGWKPQIALEQGIEKTYRSFVSTLI